MSIQGRMLRAAAEPYRNGCNTPTIFQLRRIKHDLEVRTCHRTPVVTLHIRLFADQATLAEAFRRAWEDVGRIKVQ